MVLDLRWAPLAVALLAFVAGDVDLSYSGQEAPAAAWRQSPSVSAGLSACRKKRRKSSRRRKAKRPRKTSPAPTPAPAAPSSSLVPTTQFSGPTRIDFDDRLIQGQTNKSGAVYLFDRKESGISSMVKRRKSFRQLTIRTVYDR